MTRAAITISGPRLQSEAIRAKLAFSRIEQATIGIESQLSGEAALNDHLVRIWGKLKNERRFIKRLVADGATLICHCRVPDGEIHLLPNGAEMLDLLGVELVLDAT